MLCARQNLGLNMYSTLKARKPISLIAIILMFFCMNAGASDLGVEKIQTLISGNALKITNRFGASIIYFDPDGSFEHLAEQGQTSKGKWRVTTDSMCVTIFAQPNDPPKEYCLNLINRKLGESWTEQDARNGELKRTLLKGHPAL